MKTQSGEVTLDATDRALLSAVAADATITNKALANRLGLAESTCAHRLRRLRERGVITGSHVNFDHAALGYPLQAVVSVRLGSHSEQLVEEFFDAIAATPQVLQVFHLAGTSDFLVHVAVADAAELRDIVLRHITVHRGVRQTETHLVFERRTGPGTVRKR
ncbi:MAG: Lrp/AsnC family transcriptional regulator [Micropruina sp.]